MFYCIFHIYVNSNVTDYEPDHNLLSKLSTQSSLKLIILIDDYYIGTELKFSS